MRIRDLRYLRDACARLPERTSEITLVRLGFRNGFFLQALSLTAIFLAACGPEAMAHGYSL